MQQADLIRAVGTLAAAGVGAGLALGGAALTGHLGETTTIQQVTSAAPVVPVKPVAAKSLSVQDIYRLDAPGVVQITSGRQPVAASLQLGSGFVIDKAGHIVTSNHVIDGARNLKISFSGDEAIDATIVGQDPSTDVAVLQVIAHSRSFSPLPLGDSDDVEVGEPVVAIGNNSSIDRTATVGIVSSVQRGVDTPSGAPAVSQAIQTDAMIDHGNSGGPLINMRGLVVGVSSQLVDDENGTGFAIPIDIVKTVAAQLIKTGKVQHPFLGLEAVPVNASLARSFALPCKVGLIVQSVTSGSAAASAGVRAGSISVVIAGESYRIGGDIIVAANGRPIAREAELREVIQTMKPGERLSLELWRGDKKKTVRVRMGRPPA